MVSRLPEGEMAVSLVENHDIDNESHDRVGDGRRRSRSGAISSPQQHVCYDAVTKTILREGYPLHKKAPDPERCSSSTSVSATSVSSAYSRESLGSYSHTKQERRHAARQMANARKDHAERRRYRAAAQGPRNPMRPPSRMDSFEGTSTGTGSGSGTPSRMHQHTGNKPRHKSSWQRREAEYPAITPPGMQRQVPVPTPVPVPVSVPTRKASKHDCAPRPCLRIGSNHGSSLGSLSLGSDDHDYLSKSSGMRKERSYRHHSIPPDPHMKRHDSYHGSFTSSTAKQHRPYPHRVPNPPDRSMKPPSYYGTQSKNTSSSSHVPPKHPEVVPGAWAVSPTRSEHAPRRPTRQGSFQQEPGARSASNRHMRNTTHRYAHASPPAHRPHHPHNRRHSQPELSSSSRWQSVPPPSRGFMISGAMSVVSDITDSCYGDDSLPMWSDHRSSSHSSKQTYSSSKPKSDTTLESTTTTMLEVQPGVSLPLRGKEETLHALECQFVIQTACVLCPLQLTCIADAEYVLCPVCKSISPIEQNVGSGGGIGFGSSTVPS